MGKDSGEEEEEEEGECVDDKSEPEEDLSGNFIHSVEIVILSAGIVSKDGSHPLNS